MTGCLDTCLKPRCTDSVCGCQPALSPHCSRTAGHLSESEYPLTSGKWSPADTRNVVKPIALKRLMLVWRASGWNVSNTRTVKKTYLHTSCLSESGWVTWSPSVPAGLHVNSLKTTEIRVTGWVILWNKLLLHIFFFKYSFVKINLKSKVMRIHKCDRIW